MAEAAWWLSWYATADVGPFELHSPWWISGCRLDDDARTVCAAIRASDEDAAREIVFASHDARPAQVEFRFIRRLDRSPFSDRFPRADWMQWEDADG